MTTFHEAVPAYDSTPDVSAGAEQVQGSQEADVVMSGWRRFGHVLSGPHLLHPPAASLEDLAESRRNDLTPDIDPRSR